MLTRLTLTNYRGFDKHSVHFGKHSILVGRNNAGKSTAIEALRLVSIVSARLRNLTFRGAPDWLDIPAASTGVAPSLRGIDFDFRNLHFQYDEPPSVIGAYFGNGSRITIYINSAFEELFSVVHGADNRLVASRAQAARVDIPTIQIMPAVGILSNRESVLNESYVRSNVDTRLSPHHFRNQLHYLGSDCLSTFRDLATSTWPELQIRELTTNEPPDSSISLLIRDGAFVAEVGWVGQGLQSWLQTLWFLSRVDRDATLVFDEPDVYLHADLQRKLTRFLTSNFGQTIVATHSLEIISDVPPDNIVVLDRSRRKSAAAPTLPAVQNVMDHLGGTYNLQLMRLWSAKKCLFIEGDDLDFLNAFHAKIFPESTVPFSSMPSIPIGGSGSWQHAVGAAIGFKNAGDEKIRTYCILDRDYRTADEVDEIETKALENGLNLKFWGRKEIENYLLVPEAISRIILCRTAKNPHRTSVYDDLLRCIDHVCDEFKQNVIDQTANAILNQDKRLGLPKANQKARRFVGREWSERKSRLALVPGKKAISRISAWSKQKYGVSFGSMSIARELKLEEIDGEVVNVIGAIEALSDIPKSRH